MKFSIIIPQLFHDLIARILPGFLFLLILIMGIPNVMSQLLFLGPEETDNVIDSLGKSFSIVALSYALGWMFFSFIFWSKRETTRKKHEKNGNSKSLNHKYQWIRLSHPPAGFRIVKLRAEARMFETSRTAMIAIILIAILYVVYFTVVSVISDVWTLGLINWVRLIVMLLVASILCVGFRRCEERAWEYYWANIDTIYDLLHDTIDPIREIGVHQNDT